MNPLPSGTDWKRRDALHHDREAPRYDSLIGREFAPYQDTHTARPWARLLAQEGARVVLDVGCGTGRTSLPIAEAGPAVIACDLSRGMLAEAVRKARDAGLGGRLWPLVADAEHLPLADDVVDGLVCQGVLHHLPDVSTALAEMDRILRPGAWMCLAEPDAEASLLYRSVRAALGAAVHLLRPLRRFRSPATEDERPLDPEALLGPLRHWGYELELAYLRHPPQVYRFLPRSWSRGLVSWLNRGDASRRRRADILVLRARRRPGGLD
jgi:ubiquinone/menaquinone biosynthesis C-methylase UbiE